MPTPKQGRSLDDKAILLRAKFSAEKIIANSDIDSRNEFFDHISVLRYIVENNFETKMSILQNELMAKTDLSGAWYSVKAIAKNDDYIKWKTIQTNLQTAYGILKEKYEELKKP